MTGRVKAGLALQSYLALSHLIPLLATPMLTRRRKRGKEHATRWVEKQGLALATRPKGRLVWLNAVGLGEVMSLRGLIARMHDQAPDLQFLVTSTTAVSAKVFAANLPDRTIHQFLPIDAPRYRRRFLDHFQPDLCIWAEQDLWPGLVYDTACRAIPQALIAARMNNASYARHRKAAGVYRDLYAMMALATAQDDATAAHLRDLGAQARVTGSLKPAAPPLSCDETMLRALRVTLGGRKIWAVAPSHQADEALALAAHAHMRASDPSALLIIAPRDPDRRAAIVNACPIQPPMKSLGTVPAADDPVWLCDTFGDLGLIYRLSRAVLIGGTFDTTQGHNPWEAAQLGCAILHGPNTANFAADYAALDRAGGAIPVTHLDEIVQAMQRPALRNVTNNAHIAVEAAGAATENLAKHLISLIKVTA